MNRVVVITGGARGIGKRMVEDFARAGYKVAFSYLTSEESVKNLVTTLRQEGRDVICKKMNLTLDVDIQEFVAFFNLANMA